MSTVTTEKSKHGASKKTTSLSNVTKNTQKDGRASLR